MERRASRERSISGRSTGRKGPCGKAARGFRSSPVGKARRRAEKSSRTWWTSATFYSTFAELAGVQPPQGFTIDGRSFAPQLAGKKGSPREWIYVQLGKN